MPFNGPEDASPEEVGSTSSGPAIASTEEAIVCPSLKAVNVVAASEMLCLRVPSA